MTQINTPLGPIMIPGKRPPLELGPMSGDAEYITERSENLVSTFSSLLEKDFKLEDFPVGCTDCKTFIRAPMSDQEGYLVVEHELSHNVFGTDLTLTETFREKAVERLLTRAKIPKTSPDALPYATKLDDLTHHLWNMLEDHRCCWLWSQLYSGGGSLLQQRWKDIAEYEMEETAKTDFLTYLTRRSSGIETPDAPDIFKRCAPHIVKARNLVEGVDAEACLAITARLIDDIADELLDSYPPDKQAEARAKLNAISKVMNPGGGQQKQQQQGGGGQQKQPQQQGQQQQAPQPQQPQAQQKPENKKGQGDVAGNPLGGKDLVHPPGKQPKPTAGQMKRVLQVLTSSQNDPDEDLDGHTSFSYLIQKGSEKMEERLEEARAAMAMPKKSLEEESEELLTDACAGVGAKGIFVDPTKNLPNPTATAAKLRHQLERVRMKKRLKLHEEGDDLDVEAFVEAKLNDEMQDARFFRKEKKESGMELLILIDVSGSMLGQGLQILEVALADIVFTCRNLRVNVHLWGFSDMVFFFKKIGSPIGVRGVVHRCTSMVQALDVAYEWAKKSKSTRTIILVTDGMPTSLRGRKSSGDVLQDLHNVLDEMRKDGIVLSVLAIDLWNMGAQYDKAFGAKKYGVLKTFADLGKALPEMAKVLVEAHLRRGGAP
jgi:Mg-chelatase subunit ChlD